MWWRIFVYRSRQKSLRIYLIYYNITIYKNVSRDIWSYKKELTHVSSSMMIPRVFVVWQHFKQWDLLKMMCWRLTVLLMLRFYLPLQLFLKQHNILEFDQELTEGTSSHLNQYKRPHLSIAWVTNFKKRIITLEWSLQTRC